VADSSRSQFIRTVLSHRCENIGVKGVTAHRQRDRSARRVHGLRHPTDPEEDRQRGSSAKSQSVPAAASLDVEISRRMRINHPGLRSMRRQRCQRRWPRFRRLALPPIVRASTRKWLRDPEPIRSDSNKRQRECIMKPQFVALALLGSILISVGVAKAQTPDGTEACITVHRFEPGPIVHGHHRQPTSGEIEARTLQLRAWSKASAGSCLAVPPGSEAIRLRPPGAESPDRFVELEPPPSRRTQ
jgi:hypothetical protein